MLQQLPVKLRLIGYSCVIISKRRLARFSPLYENRLVEISRESYENIENIVYDRCPTTLLLGRLLAFIDWISSHVTDTLCTQENSVEASRKIVYCDLQGTVPL